MGNRISVGRSHQASYTCRAAATLGFYACTAVWLLVPTANSHAIDLDWSQTTGLLFFDSAGNWTPSQVPPDADDLFFSIAIAPTPQIIIGASSQGNDVTLSDNDWIFIGASGASLDTEGIVTIDDPFGTTPANGTNLTLTAGVNWNNAGDAIIGDAGFGSMTVDMDADFLADQIFVGNQTGAVGEFTLTGTGTTVTATRASNLGVIVIGNNGGTGTINILADADLRTSSTGGNDIVVGTGAGSIGTLNVDGVGSFAETEDLNVGANGGTGFLNITGGGQVINSDGGANGSPDTTFGLTTGSTGGGVVDGDGSLLRSRSIFVAHAGTGQLEVRAGGVAQTLTRGSSIGDMWVGNNATGNGQVAVYGTGACASLLDVDQNLFVGNVGLGILLIGQELDGTANGTGALQVDVNLRIGDATTNTADNKVVVSGASATANVGNITYVGRSGTGTLEVTSGAQFSGRFLRVGHIADSNGTLLIDGASSLLDTTVSGQTNDSIIGTNGAANTTVSDGALLRTNRLWVGYQGASDGTLVIDSATVNSGGGVGNDLIIGGRTDLANAGGTGAVTVQNGGTLISKELTIIGGNASAAGTLTVTGAGSFADTSDNAPNGAPNDTLRIGQDGAAFVNILNGGRLDAEAVWTALGTNANAAEVVVDGAGSLFNVENFLRIGDGRASTFTVSGGGTLNVATSAAAGADNNRLIVGYLAAGDGAKLTVTDVGSTVEFFGNDRVSAGLSGGEANNRATIKVLNGAHLNAVQRDGSNAVVSSGFLMVGDSTGSHGQVTVDSSGSRIDVRHMQVGDGPSNSSGIVEITDGGTITTLDHVEVGSFGSGVGTVQVVGAGSTLAVGGYLSLGDDTLGGATNGANGTLNITDGGTVSNGGQAYVGHYTGSFGTATLGSGTSDVSSWTIGGELTVAGTETSSQLSGFGVLNVNTSGLVDVASNLRIRNLGDVNLSGGEIIVGDVVFTDAGSTFNFNSGTLRFSGNKALDAAALGGIFNGAANPTLGPGQHLAVDAAATIDAPLRLNHSTASLTVGTISDVSNLDWDAGTLSLAEQTLIVGAGGLLGESVIVSQDQALRVPNSSNNITVDAGADLNIIRGGLSTARTTNNGLVVVSNTTDVDFDVDNIGSGLTNNGDLVVIDSTIAGSITNNGHIEMVGNVTFGGSAAFEGGGSIAFDLGGTTAGDDFDVLTILGDATLGGALSVTLEAGFSPTVGDMFEIISAASVGDVFDFENLPVLGGFSWNVNYDATSVTLEFLAAVSEADFDEDGDVDGDDFLAWQSGFGSQTGATHMQGDADGDEDVDGDDFLLWQSQFGSAASRLAPVPEPASGLLVTLVLIGCFGFQSTFRIRYTRE